MRVDLNVDLGEGALGEAALFAVATSVNIACGGHAGDAVSMREALRLARLHGVAVGAHPGYEDRANFGRKELLLAPAQITAMVARQVGALKALAENQGMILQHVKPHGALYNQAACDPLLADAVVVGVVSVEPKAGVFAPMGSALALAASAAGLPVWVEAFVDRGYQANGRLIPRGENGALLDTPAGIAQALEVVSNRRVRSVSGVWIPIMADTLCVHGDGAEAAELLAELKDRLLAGGVSIKPPSSA